MHKNIKCWKILGTTIIYPLQPTPSDLCDWVGIKFYEVKNSQNTGESSNQLIANCDNRFIAEMFLILSPYWLLLSLLLSPK